jgi:hypothetical protein
MGAGKQTTEANLRDAAMKERGLGPIWGGSWFFEPPPGKVKEDRQPERKSPAEIPTKASVRLWAFQAQAPADPKTNPIAAVTKMRMNALVISNGSMT